MLLSGSSSHVLIPWGVIFAFILRPDCEIVGVLVFPDLDGDGSAMFPTPPLPTECFNGRTFMSLATQFQLNGVDIPFELHGQPHVCV